MVPLIEREFGAGLSFNPQRINAYVLFSAVMIAPVQPFFIGPDPDTRAPVAAAVIGRGIAEDLGPRRGHCVDLEVEFNGMGVVVENTGSLAFQAVGDIGKGHPAAAQGGRAAQVETTAGGVLQGIVEGVEDLDITLGRGVGDTADGGEIGTTSPGAAFQYESVVGCGCVVPRDAGIGGVGGCHGQAGRRADHGYRIGIAGGIERRVRRAGQALPGGADRTGARGLYLVAVGAALGNVPGVAVDAG